MKLIIAAISDFYRLGATICDWRTLYRKLSHQAEFDVACITNFETAYQRAFIGLLMRKIANGLRYSINGKLGRFILINSDAAGVMRPHKRGIAKRQLLKAIDYSASKGVQVILFAASTKRLLAEKELCEVQAKYPHITFTNGDNGTALALLTDIYDAIDKFSLTKNDNILVIGPNGFLGSIVRQSLASNGYQNIRCASYKDKNPFKSKTNIKMVIACSHHKKLRLTAKNLDAISCKQGVVIVDVCKPGNLSDNEYKSAISHGLNIVKIRSGMYFNKNLKFCFSSLAKLVLKNLSLTRHVLYGCFSEATALAQSNHRNNDKLGFMEINENAMNYVRDCLQRSQYQVVSDMFNNSDTLQKNMHDIQALSFLK